MLGRAMLTGAEVSGVSGRGPGLRRRDDHAGGVDAPAAAGGVAGRHRADQGAAEVVGGDRRSRPRHPGSRRASSRCRSSPRRTTSRGRRSGSRPGRRCPRWWACRWSSGPRGRGRRSAQFLSSTLGHGPHLVGDRLDAGGEDDPVANVAGDPDPHGGPHGPLGRPRIPNVLIAESRTPKTRARRS